MKFCNLNFSIIRDRRISIVHGGKTEVIMAKYAKPKFYDLMEYVENRLNSLVNMCDPSFRTFCDMNKIVNAGCLISMTCIGTGLAESGGAK